MSEKYARDVIQRLRPLATAGDEASRTAVRLAERYIDMWKTPYMDRPRMAELCRDLDVAKASGHADIAELFRLLEGWNWLLNILPSLPTTQDFDAVELVGQQLSTIAEPVRGVGRFVRLKRYGHLIIVMEPFAGPKQIRLEWQVREDEVSKEYMPASLAGIREAVESASHDSPIINVRICIVGGSTHAVDSSELSFKIAALLAYKDAYQRATRVAV